MAICVDHSKCDRHGNVAVIEVVIDTSNGDGLGVVPVAIRERQLRLIDCRFTGITRDHAQHDVCCGLLLIQRHRERVSRASLRGTG